MKKKILSVIMISGALVGLGACGTTTTGSSEEIVFKVGETEGKIEFSTDGATTTVYYVNNNSNNTQYDLSHAAAFNVGENQGDISKFAVMNDILYYPNLEVDPSDKAQNILVYRPILLSSASGDEIIAMDQALFEQYSSAMEYYGWANLGVGDYISISLNLDFSQASGGVVSSTD